MMIKTENKIKIMIADDHSVVRKGLIQILSETDDLKVVAEAENGRELLNLLKEQSADLIVMDIDMPEKSGWDVLNLVKREYPHLRVIILSISPEEEFATNFLQAGAAGYLNKASAPEQLVEAIRKVYRGGKYVSPKMADKLIMEMGQDKEKPAHETLSPREFQIFCLIASGTTVKEMAKKLSLSIPTISTYRARILEKMSLKNNAQLMRYAFKHKMVS